jgi:hypothetical protein
MTDHGDYLRKLYADPKPKPKPRIEDLPPHAQQEIREFQAATTAHMQRIAILETQVGHLIERVGNLEDGLSDAEWKAKALSKRLTAVEEQALDGPELGETVDEHSDVITDLMRRVAYLERLHVDGRLHRSTLDSYDILSSSAAAWHDRG